MAEPGQFVTFDILDQSVIVSNRRQLHAFYNASLPAPREPLDQRAARQDRPGVPLRLSFLVLATVQGTLRNAPRTERLPDFDKKQYGLKPVKLEVMGSFVFINMDPDARAARRDVRGCEAKMAQFLPDLADMKLISEVDVIVPANWKVIMDNSIEGYHFGLSGPVHKELARPHRLQAIRARGPWQGGPISVRREGNVDSRLWRAAGRRDLADRLVLQHRDLAEHDLLLLPLPISAGRF